MFLETNQETVFFSFFPSQKGFHEDLEKSEMKRWHAEKIVGDPRFPADDAEVQLY